MSVYHNIFKEIVYHNLVPTKKGFKWLVLTDCCARPGAPLLSLELLLLPAGAESDRTTRPRDT